MNVGDEILRLDVRPVRQSNRAGRRYDRDAKDAPVVITERRDPVLLTEVTIERTDGAAEHEGSGWRLWRVTCRDGHRTLHDTVVLITASVSLTGPNSRDVESRSSLPQRNDALRRRRRCPSRRRTRRPRRRMCDPAARRGVHRLRARIPATLYRMSTHSKPSSVARPAGRMTTDRRSRSWASASPLRNSRSSRDRRLFFASPANQRRLSALKTLNDPKLNPLTSVGGFFRH